MKIAEKEYKNKVKTTTKQSKKVVEKIPDWFDKDFDVKEMTPEEVKAFEERLKNIK